MTENTITHDDEQVDEPRASIRSAFRLLRPHRALMTVAFVLTGLGVVFSLAQPYTSKMLIDTVRSGDPVTVIVVGLLVLFVVAALLEASSQYLLERVSESAARDMRVGLARRLLAARIPSLQRFRTGDLLSRATTDTTLVREMLASSLVQLFSVLLYGVGTVALMVWLDPIMLLVMLGTIVAAALIVSLVLASIRTATEDAQNSVGEFSAGLERVLGSLRTVKAYLAESQELDRLSASAHGAYRSGLRAARLNALVSPAMELAVNGALLVVLVVGGARVATGTMDVGDLVAFLLYATYLVMPLAGLFSALALLQRGLGALQRIEETETIEEETVSGGPAPAAPAPVVFENVSLTYPGSNRGVSALELSLPASGVVALVGPSGVGKSTILDLIERFYAPDAGRILVAGTPLDTVSVRRWRESVALVDQDSPVLDGSIRDNLLYGRAEGADEDIWAALRKVGLESFIQELPDGLDSHVGERGRSLSGGERQRLVLARAMLTTADIYLLDEPSSNLDLDNAALVADAIRELGERGLVIVVAHHQQMVDVADIVYRLDGGGLHEITGQHT
ncbi:MAG: ABC transporter ATP-binding protein [Microbacteriaceae bacterium]